MQQPPPTHQLRLLGPVHSALEFLYAASTHHHSQCEHAALRKQHEGVLTDFQSRNLRKHIRSLQQRHQSRQSNGNTNQHRLEQDANEDAGAAVSWGSSWMVALVLIQQQQSSSYVYPDAIRLFAAQTLLHRIRRSKVYEAMDWECELDLQLPPQQQQLQLSPLQQQEAAFLAFYPSLQHLQALIHYPQAPWMQQLHPLMGLILSHWIRISSSSSSSRSPISIQEQLTEDELKQYLETQLRSATTSQPSTATAKPSSDEVVMTAVEKCLKAEWTVVTLTTMLFWQAVEDEQQQQQVLHSNPTTRQSRRPLFTTLVAVLAAAVFRLRYATASTNLTDNDNKSQWTMLEWLQKVCDTVYQVAIAAAVNTSGTGDDSNNAAATGCYQRAIYRVLWTTVGALPEAILETGGSRGRITADPLHLRAAAKELRRLPWDSCSSSGSGLLSSASLLLNGHNGASSPHQHAISLTLLEAFQLWATYLPLPATVLTTLLLPLLRSVIEESSGAAPDSASTNARVVASWRLLIVVFEGASWTVEQVLSSTLGLYNSNNNALRSGEQSTKKRSCSNRTKKRQKEFLSKQTTDDNLSVAEAERKQRGDLACQITIHCWDVMEASIRQALLQANMSPTVSIDGEGPLGGFSVCANACLPHILRHTSTNNSEQSKEFLSILTGPFQDMCASSNPTARCMALEPIRTLHTSLLAVNDSDFVFPPDLENLLVNHFVQSALKLASSCGYPTDYFAQMGMESDQELEMERNDIRDILRTVGGSGSGGSTAVCTGSDCPLPVALRILAQLVESCRSALLSSVSFQEPVVHAFSSLAKPINHLALYCSKSGGGSPDMLALVQNSLEVLSLINRATLAAFESALPLTQLLPISRLVNITNASLSPFVSILVLSPDAPLQSRIRELLTSIVQGSILSVEQIPELLAASILDHSIYDIRGAMRGPGGEDHVGIIALKRYSVESPQLALVFAEVLLPFVSRVCVLYRTLKQAEVARGRGIHHGTGVTPESRRILIAALCRLESISTGKLGSSPLLEDLFKTAVEGVSGVNTSIVLGDEQMYQLVERVLDLSSFPADIVGTLFQDCPSTSDGIHVTLVVIASAICRGYESYPTLAPPPEVLEQWNRLRGALFRLCQQAIKDDLSHNACQIICSCIAAELHAIKNQLGQGQHSPSLLFNDENVSPDSVPAGLLCRLISTAMNKRRNKATIPENVLQCLHAIKQDTLSVVTSTHPMSIGHVDPRLTVTESWFLIMRDIAKMEYIPIELIQSLLADSCVAAFTLMYYPRLAKTQEERMSAPGMNMDAPQTLIILEFVERYFALGTNALQAVSEKLVHVVPFMQPSQTPINSAASSGCTVACAGLFRASQGALPPWGTELVPGIFHSLFVGGMGQNVHDFLSVFESAMTIRSNSTFGSVESGQLLSGRYFQTMHSQSKDKFLIDVRKICEECCSKGGSVGSWKQFKSILKKACGGKKKATDFNQKPPLTSWEKDRI